ncbi:hypothetical protein D9M72_285100 [compost metagenome]
MQVGGHCLRRIAFAARRGKAPFQVVSKHVAADADEQRFLGWRDFVQAPPRAAHALGNLADGQRRHAFGAQQPGQFVGKFFVGASGRHETGGKPGKRRAREC